MLVLYGAFLCLRRALNRPQTAISGPGSGFGAAAGFAAADYAFRQGSNGLGYYRHGYGYTGVGQLRAENPAPTPRAGYRRVPLEAPGPFQPSWPRMIGR